MKLTVTGTLDVEAIIRDQLDQLDLSAVGADGDSEYDVDDTEITAEAVPFVVTLDVTHVRGKFASRDEVEEAVVELLNEVEGVEV